MIEIEPKFELLFTDLKKHGVGHFLDTRKFKIFLSQHNYSDIWKVAFEFAKKSRRFYMAGLEHDFGDSETALVYCFNSSVPGSMVERFLVSGIIIFIDSQEEKKDFSDVVESSIHSGFNSEDIMNIKKVKALHDKKVFTDTENRIKPIDMANLSPMLKSEIFIVHGHNGEAKLNVTRTLEHLGLKPIILHEQSNSGQTIIEKFEKYADVDFAIVLLTYDDLGNAKGVSAQNKRARQNVIFELGYFIGRLGRKRVMPMYEEGVELPSDMAGVLYTPLDKHEAWKGKLVKELKDAGYKVDANKIL